MEGKEVTAIMKRRICLTTCIIAFLGISCFSQAELIDRGGGLIYDTDLNITWLQSPNNTFMTVAQAHDWVTNLFYFDSVRNQTLTGWRLPKAIEGPYTFGYDGTTTGGYNITASEMGHLFHIALGNKGYYFTDGSSPQPGWGLNNKGSFSDLQPYYYWTDVQVEGIQGSYWVFSFNDGAQLPAVHNGTSFGGNGYYALAVRSGDVAALVHLPGDFDTDGNVDGSDLAELIATPGQLAIQAFAQNFGKSLGIAPLGFGTISGETGYVLVESSTSVPSFHVTQIDFGLGYDEAQLSLLAKRAQLISGDLSGGSSNYSVAFSYEILSRVEGAMLLKAGSDIIYSDPSGKITNYLISVGGTKLGVMVARAIVYPPGTTYTLPQAQALLTSKLQNIQLSTANVSADDEWTKQILHVFAYDQQHVDMLSSAYNQIDASTKGNTIVYITRTDAADDFLFGM